MLVFDTMEEQHYERAKEFIKAAEKLGGRNPFAEHEIVWDNNVGLTLCIDIFQRDSVRLSEIRSFEASKGHGSAALKRLCALADQQGIRLVGVVQPTIKGRLNKRQLFSWYKRHGFQQGQGDNISRIPA